MPPDEKKELIEHDNGLLKIDSTKDSEKDSGRPLPARWESVNDAFKMIDKCMVDAINKFKLSPYEVHLVLACFEFKKDTVQLQGYFKEALEDAISDVMKDGSKKTPDFIK